MFAAVLQRAGCGLRPLLSTQCNLIYKNACHQYREVGDHTIICRESPRYHFCQQTCNSANCRLQCNSPLSCDQQCMAGRCETMLCNSKNCSQKCIRGSCQLMDCAGKTCQQSCYMGGCSMVCSNDAEICIQSCEAGKCAMRCPHGVKMCKQTCKGGKCTMTCNAQKCRRSCDGGQCAYSTKIARDVESAHMVPRYPYCNDGINKDTCVQNCPEGNCNMKYKYTPHASLQQLCAGGNCHFHCMAPLRCTQICMGGTCKKYLCKSNLCIQECVAGGCNMECEAETCLQICRGGDCSMDCLSNVKECLQWCPAGNCILGCSAKHCRRYCNSASCIVSDKASALKGTLRRVRCSTVARECYQKCPSRRSCAFLGWAYFGVFHSTYQICSEGDCRLMHCTTSNKCTQKCHDGACESIVCTANICLQYCNGANCNMECTAQRCTQVCHGGGCKMKCMDNVETCHQSCNSQISDCQIVCLARSCTITLL